jgi:hypothetical protein
VNNEGSATSNPATRKNASTIWQLRIAVCYVMIVACLPYLILKVLWLFGYTPGAASAAGAGELGDVRHIIGNLATAGMELVAIALVLALTYPWGQRLPVMVTLVPIWVGVGLLAPIMLGLPLGLVAQAFAGGSPVPIGNGLDSWVYTVVYGGFIVQALGLLAAFFGYALQRWPEVLRKQMAQLNVITPRQRRLATIAAIITVGYAVILVLWSVTGPRLGGPAGFDTVAQRSFLFSTGLIVLVGAIAALALVWRWGKGRILAPLILAWIGTGVIVTSGPTHVALSNMGEVSLLLVLVSIAAVLSGLLLSGSAVRVLARSHVV